MAIGDEPGPYPPLYGKSPGQVALEGLRELTDMKSEHVVPQDIIREELSRHDVFATMDYVAGRIVKALEEKGLVICSMPGGVHRMSCPTCGCRPLHGFSVD